MLFRKNKNEIKIRRPLRTFNNLLTVVVLCLSVYIIVTPFLPHASLWWTEFNDTNNGVRYQGELSREQGNTNEAELAPIPEVNTLVVPDIQVDTPIIEGQDISALSVDGVWRRPHTSTPDRGSNTVIVAHRFSYSDPATFYHLDKVEQGHKFALYWNQQEYVYEVFDISVVNPDQIEIEAPTDEPIVTLYTCTPVWTAAQRLVVKARLVSDPTGNLLDTNSEVSAL
jgi:sortase A